MSGKGRPYSDVRSRLLAYHDVDENSGCWVWNRARIARDRYGVLNVRGVQTYAHRASYEQFVGPIPEGMQVDHRCKNKGCINPAHLEPVTGMENVRRALRIGHPGAPQTCKWGHDWSVHPPNISRRRSGRARGLDKRDCSVCQRERNAKRTTSQTTDVTARGADTSATDGQDASPARLAVGPNPRA